MVHISNSVITGKEDAVVWRTMNKPTEALVRMVSPSPTVDEDKVSHEGEGGVTFTYPGDPNVEAGKPS